jgi:uncharacterized protein YwgA
MNEMNDLVHLAKETEKLYMLCDNHNEWDAMHQRMETMLEEDIKPTLVNIKTQMAELKVFIQDVIEAMKKAFAGNLLLIEKMAEKNTVLVEAQHHRLKDFEERNVEHPDNS